MIDYILFVAFISFIILAVIFLGIWTYEDAKARGLNAGMWTAIVMFVPNLIGLLIYFLVGRNQEYTECDYCKSRIPKSAKYCMNCGREVVNIDINKYFSKKHTRKYMIGFIACIIAAVITSISFIIVLMNNDMHFTRGYSIRLIETNIGNKWNISYLKSTATFSKNINIKDGKPEKLYIDFNCDNGTVELSLKQQNKVESFQLTKEKNNYEIDLKQFNNGKLKLYLNGKNARNVKFKAHWNQ